MLRLYTERAPLDNVIVKAYNVCKPHCASIGGSSMFLYEDLRTKLLLLRAMMLVGFIVHVHGKCCVLLYRE